MEQERAHAQEGERENGVRTAPTEQGTGPTSEKRNPLTLSPARGACACACVCAVCCDMLECLTGSRMVPLRWCIWRGSLP